jgi:hypothetical protein
MRWETAVVMIVGLVALSGETWAETSPAASPVIAPVAGDQWRTTDRSMLDLVEEGYELVSVIVTQSRARVYFLGKPGKMAKCQEDTTVSWPSDAPPPPVRGQTPAFVPDNFVPETQMVIECAELARPEKPGH